MFRQDGTLVEVWAFQMYLLHAGMLNFRAESGRNLTYSGHALVRFLPVVYGEDYSTVQGVDKREDSGTQLSAKHGSWWF